MIFQVEMDPRVPAFHRQVAKWSDRATEWDQHRPFGTYHSCEEFGCTMEVDAMTYTVLPGRRILCPRHQDGEVGSMQQGNTKSGQLIEGPAPVDGTANKTSDLPVLSFGSVTTAPIIRKFETGATRDLDTNKLDYEGFLSPLVLERYAQYMHKNRVQKDGSIRASDNWTKGIPLDAYMKSGWRHFHDWWMEHRSYGSREGIEEALCGLLFNAMGYLHELLKKNREAKSGICRQAA